MVRNGFDRQDLMTMPVAELLQWHDELKQNLKAEADATKQARKK